MIEARHTNNYKHNVRYQNCEKLGDHMRVAPEEGQCASSYLKSKSTKPCEYSTGVVGNARGWLHGSPVWRRQRIDQRPPHSGTNSRACLQLQAPRGPSPLSFSPQNQAPLDESLGVKARAAPFMQYLLPVGAGPSSNTCPRWDLHLWQRISVLG